MLWHFVGEDACAIASQWQQCKGVDLLAELNKNEQ